MIVFLKFNNANKKKKKSRMTIWPTSDLLVGYFSASNRELQVLKLLVGLLVVQDLELNFQVILS